MSSRKCLLSVVTTLVLAGVLLSSPYSAYGQMPGDVTRELFNQVVETTGKEYVKLRSDLLNRHDAAEVLLAQQRRSDPMSQRRWLADILIARRVHAGEMGSLEQTMYDKVTMPRPTLELMVTDRNIATPTRRMAVIVLGELGDTRSVVVLIVVVRDVDQDTHLRLDALYSLARIGDATAIGGMRDVAIGDGAVAQRAMDLIEQVRRGGVDRMYFE